MEVRDSFATYSAERDDGTFDALAWQRMCWTPGNGLTHYERCVAAILGIHRNQDNGQCNPSATTITAEAGMSRRMVFRALGGLEKKMWITRIPGNGVTTRYSLNQCPPCTSAPQALVSKAKPDKVVHPRHPTSAHQALPLVHTRHTELLRETTKGTTPEDSSNPPTARAKKPPAKAVEVDEAFRERMRQRFGPHLGMTVDERIDECLAYPTTQKWPNKQLAVQKWLRTEAERAQSKPYTNGHKPAPRQLPATPEYDWEALYNGKDANGRSR